MQTIHLNSSFWGWLGQSTVQVSVLIGLILLLQFGLRRWLSVRWRYALWLLLVLRMILPWSPQSRISLFNLLPQEQTVKLTASPEDTAKLVPPLLIEKGIETLPPWRGAEVNPVDYEAGVTKEAATGQIPMDERGTRLSLDKLRQEISKVLPLVWLVGAGVLGGYIAVSNIRLWRTVKRQRPLTRQGVLELLEDCKTQMNIQTVLAVVATDEVKSPALFGFVRPRLLIPAGMLEALNEEELKCVFLHELAHLKRHDIAMGWLTSILLAMHWFNPLVWLAFSRMRADRELVCDALALTYIGEERRPRYGRTILRLLERFAQQGRLPSMAGILESKTDLKRRITMIAGFKQGSYRLSLLSLGLILVLGGVVLTNAGAQEKEAKAKEPEVLAREFVDMLTAGKFDQASEGFDQKMKEAMSSKDLAQAWNSTTAEAGPFKRQVSSRREKFLASDIVYVTCEFAKGPLDVKVVYDEQKKISGLWFVPTPMEVWQKFQEKTDQVILKDSFEQGAGAPSGWEKRNVVNGVEYIWDKNQGSDGKASLCLKKTANKYFPIAQWTRKIEHKTNDSKLAISTKVKAENVTKAILDTLFLDENDKWIKHEWVSYIGQKKEENIPPANHDWKTYSGVAAIPENTKTIVIGLQMYGPGTVWFDDLEVAYLKEIDKAKGKQDKLLAEGLTAEGWQLWEQRKLAEAEEKFKEAVGKDPTNDGAYQGLGWSQLNQGKKLNAKVSFEKSIEINSKNSAALNGLGWIAKGQGKTDEAIEYWQKAIAALPQATAALNGLATTYMETQQYDKAQEVYKKWLLVEPDNKEAQEGLAKAQAQIAHKSQ